MKFLSLLILWAGSLTSPGVTDRETVAAPSPHEGLTVLECGHDSGSALLSSDHRPSDVPALVTLAETAEEEDDHGPDTPADLGPFPPPSHVAGRLPTFAPRSRTGAFRKPFRSLPLRC